MPVAATISADLTRLKGFDEGPLFDGVEDDAPLSDGIEDDAPAGEFEETPQGLAATFSDVSAWQIALATIIVAAALGIVLFTNRRNRLVESDIRASFSRLGSWANWIGVDLGVEQTPYEQANMLTAVLPEGRQPIRRIVQNFVHRTFSSDGSRYDKVNSKREWRELRPLFWRKSAERFFERFSRKR